MKNFGLLWLAVAGIALALPMNSSAAPILPPQAVSTQGTEVPFPFGTEIPFPWAAIEGTWEVRGREIDAYFSFQVQRDDVGAKVLKVTHIDKMTRRVFGEGAGFANPEQKIVRAVMRSDDFNYLIFVRVFRDTKAKTEARTATVLTIRYFGGVGTSDIREQHYILRRVSKQPMIFRN